VRPINIVAETNPQLIKRLLPVTARVEVGTTGSGDRVATVDAGVGELLAVGVGELLAVGVGELLAVGVGELLSVGVGSGGGAAAINVSAASLTVTRRLVRSEYAVPPRNQVADLISPAAMEARGRWSA
jgi:hypothetical protein